MNLIVIWFDGIDATNIYSIQYFLIKCESNNILYTENLQGKNTNSMCLSLKSLRALANVEGSGITTEYIESLLAKYKVENGFILLPDDSINKEEKPSLGEIKKLVKKLDIPQKFIAALRKLTVKQYEKAKSKLYEIACDFSVDEISRHKKIIRYLRGISTKRKVRKPYSTYKRLEVLTFIHENPYCDFATILDQCELSKSALKAALPEMVQQELLNRKLVGRKYQYVVSRKGLTSVVQQTVLFLNEHLDHKIVNTQCKNKTISHTPLQLVRKTMTLSKQLRGMGIFAPRVKEIIERKEITSLEKYVNGVVVNKSIKKPGAFIFSEIIRGIPLSAKLKGMGEKILDCVAQEVRQVYKKLCGDYHLHEKHYVHFANCLAKAQCTMELKGKTLQVHDAHRIFGWLVKRWGGASIEGSERYDTKTYAGKNRLFAEIIRPRMENNMEVLQT